MIDGSFTLKRDIPQLPLCCLINPYLTCFKCNHRECINCLGKEDKVWQAWWEQGQIENIVCCHDCFEKMKW